MDRMKWLPDGLRAAGDVLMPRVCLVCGRPLGLHERDLCLACAADIPFTYNWLQVHHPMADRFNAMLERYRGTEPMDYAYAVALLYYKGAYRNIPRALKYHADLSAGRHYGTLLGRRIAAAPHLADVDLILPVPLHWTRRRARGYNQAEVLARAIAAVLTARGPSALGSGSVASALGSGQAASRPVCRTDLLVRQRRTRSQTRLSVDEKARNVASAFKVPERWGPVARLRRLVGRVLPLRRSPFDGESPLEALAHARHILLVDDTFTTGATLCACYRALRPFTPARISIATLAAVEGTPAVSPLCSDSGTSGSNPGSYPGTSHIAPSSSNSTSGTSGPARGQSTAQPTNNG